MAELAALLATAGAARAAQDMVRALEAADAALARAPQSPEALLVHAQLHYEAGLPAADAFAAAVAANPGRPELVRNHALALVGEGAEVDGLARLEALVAAHPRWLDGQRTLAGLRTTLGDPDFARGYAKALKAAPMEPGLWLGWFHALAQARQWRAAGDVLDSAAAVLGETRAVRLSRLYLASESGAGADDPTLFDAVEHEADPGLDLARIRHFLRGGQAERARDVALRHLGQPTMRPFWAYLALAWRLLGDARAEWLDGGTARVGLADLDLSAADLAELAALLRALHQARAPWHEQSVRGGTQTDRPLLLRIDPVILRVRRAIEQAVAAYIDALPPHDPQHPLLAAPRKGFRFAGSWSVRLSPGGFHAVHTHPMGWISSALYVTVPEPAERGTGEAGHLAFGGPPPELGLPLKPYGSIAPAPARLALFPSTLWHGTVPFDGGERMTIAFDVVPA